MKSIAIVTLLIFSSACAVGLDPEMEAPAADEPIVDVVEECVVNTPGCESVAGGEYVDAVPREQDLLRLINQWRSVQVECRGQLWGPSSPVEMDDILHRAARGHSRDIAGRNVVSRQGADGELIWDRTSGYGGVARGEAVRGGPAAAENVVHAWINDPAQCMVLLLPEATHVGVGYHFDDRTDARHFWTLIVGTY